MPVKSELSRCLAQIELFRALNAEFPSQQIATFFIVALNPGITLEKLGQELGMAQSSTSRNVAALSDFFLSAQGDRRPGYGLLEKRENPQNTKEKIVQLTSKGERLAEALRRIQ